MIDWAEVLLKAGIDVPLGTNEVLVQCPFHDDKIASCAINVEKGVWICFAGCGQGSLKTFLRRHLNYNDIQLKDILEEKSISFNIDMFDEPKDTSGEGIDDVLIPNFIEGVFPDWIYDRGFTSTTLNFWGCGTNKWKDLIIPIHNKQDKLIGWVARRVNAIPKYMYAYKFQKSKVLFGANKIKDQKHFICVTEGALDTMWLRQHGIDSVSILGATMSKEQSDLLKFFKTQEIILCFDNDVAGQRATDKAMNLLVGSTLTSSISLPKEYKDVQEIKNNALLQEVIAERSFL